MSGFNGTAFNGLTQADVVDSLTSTATDKPLSAAQGKALKTTLGSTDISNIGASVTAAISSLNSNKVSKSGDTMTDNLIISKTANPAILFNNTQEDKVGIYCDVEKNRIFFNFKHLNDNNIDHYIFPESDTSGITKGYDVLTTKNVVTIAQGGTGATQPGTTLLKNLGIQMVTVTVPFTNGSGVYEFKDANNNNMNVWLLGVNTVADINIVSFIRSAGGYQYTFKSINNASVTRDVILDLYYIRDV